MSLKANPNTPTPPNLNARLRNFQYDRTGATDLLPLRDVYCLALEGA